MDPPLLPKNIFLKGYIIIWFIKTNQRMFRKPFPIPKIQDMMLHIEVFMNASTL